MATRTAPRLIGIAPGDPKDPGTLSGISMYLLGALREQGALAGAVSGRPELVDVMEKAASFSPSRRRWRQRFSSRSSVLSPAARRAWSRRASRGLEELASRADATLQLGGWYDLADLRRRSGLLGGSFHDGNLATYLQHPDLELDLGSRGIRRAWEFEQRLYDGLDLIFTMSDWVAQTFVEQFGQPSEKVVTVRAGANLPALPAAPNRDSDRSRFLFVGKGDFARKGGPELIAAFRQIRAEFPRAELWLVGPDRPPSSDPGVVFLGRISRSTPAGLAEINRVYREATAFVMPSRYEPFGIVFLEAMAYRLPCIGSRACAMPEIIENGVTGFVVPPGDADGLADCMHTLVSEPDRAREMGEAGHRRLLELFTWNGAADRILREIELRLERRSQ